MRRVASGGSHQFLSESDKPCPVNVDRAYILLLSNLIEEGSMYSGVARSRYRQHSCDDVTKMGLCDWFTN